MKFTYRSNYFFPLLAFASFLLIDCSNSTKSTDDKLTAVLPPDQNSDATRGSSSFTDLNSDALRGDGLFNYKSLLDTELNVQVDAYDFSSLTANQVAELGRDEVGQREIAAGKDVIVTLRDFKSKRALFTGKTDKTGKLKGHLMVPAHITKATLELTCSKFHPRTVVVENLPAISSISRVMGMVSSQDSVVNNTLADADQDGVPDIYDAFPNDITRAFRFATPADGSLTVAFEDNYPNLGDGDYNDFLASYQTVQVLNADNKIVEISTDVQAVARLAGYDHRFGIVVNFPGAQAQRTITNKNQLGQNTSTQTASVTDKSNAVVFDHTAQAFTSGKGHTANVRLVFVTPIDPASIDTSPYDPYIYIHNTTYDVHLLGKPALPNSHNPANSNGFRDANGYPRGLLVPANWYYPKEGKFIEDAFLKFKPWRTNVGQTNSDWYLFPEESLVVRSENDFSDKPSVTVPGGYDSNYLQIAIAGITPPPVLGYHFKPVSKVYDISMTNGQNNFGNQNAEIRFKYDLAAITAAGLLEEFAVFYYDDVAKVWKNSYASRTDFASKEVIVSINHFTPYVLTAMPATGGGIANPPSCITADYPPGSVTSSSPALFAPKFTMVGDSFRYYQDRIYNIVPKALSAQNTTTFAALGFDFALGISTCNGMPGGTFNCGVLADNKQKTTPQYIQFIAHKDIDVYVMYDIRGGGPAGATNTNNANDAPWLASAGFTDVIGGQRYFVETTDGVRYYRVYKKTYFQGQQVTLDGNRMGVGVPSIDTNYWVIIKALGDTTSSGASALCVAQADTSGPGQVTSVIAVPGASQVMLTWQNPNDPDFAGVVIRRSQSPASAPMTAAEGVAPSPSTVLSTQGFRDDSVSPGNSYWYTIFSLDLNNNYVPGPPVLVTTSVDSDGDGLSDVYEDSVVYPTTLKSNIASADTDGDGISDGAEVIARTDPTNPDITKPTVTLFNTTGPTPGTTTVVPLAFTATDNTGVTGYIVTLTNTQPYSDAPGWQPIAPLSVTVPATLGTYNIYAWVKDAAGNISIAATFAYVLIDGTPPVAGNAITFTLVNNSHLTVNWGAASDDYSPSASLQYKVVKDNFSVTNINSVTLSDAKIGADLIQDWTTAITTKLVTGLARSTPYYFAVLVRDVAGNLTLYAPASQTTTAWEITASMATPRYSHTATLLTDGRVLVTGGNGTGGMLSSAEIFDPAGNAGAGSFTTTASMASQRLWHTATLLTNGRVLVMGGYGSGILSSAQLFDSAGNAGAGSFTATASMASPRYLHTATLLTDGRVLVTGGNGTGNSSGILSSAEIFDPAGNAGAGSFTATASVASPRYLHTATLLTDGRVLVTGGVSGSGTLSSAEIFDPTGNAGTGSFTTTASMASPRYQHTATLLTDGRVLMTGGASGSYVIASAEIFDPAGNAGAGSFTTTASMASKRYVHTATLLTNGRVLVTGGNGSGILSSAEIFDPAGNTSAGSFTTTASMASPRYQHTAALLTNGRVLVTGGHNGTAPISSAELSE